MAKRTALAVPAAFFAAAIEAAPAGAQTVSHAGDATTGQGTYWKMVVKQAGSRLQIALDAKGSGLDASFTCEPTELKADGTFSTRCTAMRFDPRTVSGTLQQAQVSSGVRLGRAEITLRRLP
ncbi:MAG: hypothetical protein JNL07_06700 [Rhodospirillales bacterium]|nr:hypothetical protein [Rhodospirillales bacterium]